MTNLPDLTSIRTDCLVPHADPLRMAVAAYLARFQGSSRGHTESDLRCFLRWCAAHGLEPLSARRPHLDAVHPVDAGDPPVQALHRDPAVLRRSRVLPDLRHRRPAGAFVTTMLDAGVDLRDVQIAARHTDARTTMRYDRARKNLDRHPNYILAAYMATGT
jgi:integrase